MKKIIITVVAVAIIAGAGVFLKKQKEQVGTLSKPNTYLHAVEVIEPKEGVLEQTQAFLAQVQSSKSASIASKFNATIKKIYVNESDKVKKNQLLIELDDSDIVATLASLKAQEKALKADLANAKAIYMRNKELLKIDAISQEAMQTSEVAYSNKQSALQATKQKIKQTNSALGYLNIRAPFSGVIGSKLANEGSLALVGRPLLTLNSDDQKLTFSFIETSKPITQNAAVYFRGKKVGKVLKRYDDAKNALLVAEVQLETPLAFANKSYLNIEVAIANDKGCVVPMEAILHKSNGSFVMLYNNRSFHAKAVEVLLHNDTKALLKECPKEPVAIASEAKLSILPSYKNILIGKE